MSGAARVTLIQESPGGSLPVHHAAWLDDTRIVVGQGPELILWNTTSQTMTQRFRHGTRLITALAVNPAAEHVSAFTESGHLYVWDLTTGTSIYTTTNLSIREHMSVDKLATGLNGQVIVSSPSINARPQQTITYLWNLARSEVLTRPVGMAGFLVPDGSDTLFEVNTLDGTLQAVDLQTQTMQWTFESNDSKHIRVRDGDSTSIFMCSYTYCYLVDSHTGTLQQKMALEERHIQNAYLLSNRVVVVSTDLAVQEIIIDVFDRNTGEEVRTFQFDRPVYEPPWLFMNMTVSSQGLFAIAFGLGSDAYDFPVEPSNFSPVFVYDLESGTQLATLDTHTDAVNVLAFNPSGTRLFTGSSDRTFKIWEIEK